MVQGTVIKDIEGDNNSFAGSFHGFQKMKQVNAGVGRKCCIIILFIHRFE